MTKIKCSRDCKNKDETGFCSLEEIELRKPAMIDMMDCIQHEKRG